MKEQRPPTATDQQARTDHSKLFNIHPALMRILHERGYDTPEKIEGYLNPGLSAAHSPFLMKGMYDAVSRIRKALERDQKIGIFADSDLDGITSLAVLHTLLTRMKKDVFLRYLKNDENYGLTREIIDEFLANSVELMITVDSGTRDLAEISYARSRGMDVIVTDHHEQDSELPDAIVLNPKINESEYPFRHLAGVGVAFKLCLAILMSYQPSYTRKFIIIIEADTRCLVAVVKDGTVERALLSDDVPHMTDIIRQVGEDETILVYDNQSLVVLLAELFPGRRIHDMRDFIRRVARSDDSSLDKLFSASASHGVNIDEMPTFLASILLEAQMTGSDKISEFIDSVLGLVAIGSVADVIPLVGENRYLVKRGIDILNRRKHPAISQLMNGEPINSRAIGWSIAPLLNTPGRLGMTELSVRFFIENERDLLKRVIAEIKSLNENRRSFINEFCSKTIVEINNGFYNILDRLIYIKTDGVPDGYAGLIANRISDETGKPTIVAVLPGKQGLVKGSGRSHAAGRFFTIVEQFRERFDRIGGHENAFGFTVRADQVDEVAHAIACAMDGTSTPENHVTVDAELDISLITVEFIRQIGLMEPFGTGNEEPLFMTRNLNFETFVLFGKNHGKFVVEGREGLTAIGWGMGPVMKDYFESGRPFDMVYRLENNAFNGSVSPRMIIRTIGYAI
jgi:single-stranded-DNA-specific exonuclease